MVAMKPLYGTAVIALSTVTLAGCVNLSRFEPTVDYQSEAHKVVEISVRSNSVEQVVLGELYKQGLERKGRAATVNMDRLGIEHNIDRLPQGETDLVIACAGRLLHHLQPAKAQELEEKYSANEEEDINSGDRREEVYAAVMGSIGDNINGADPSNTLGCSEFESAIPQHIIPIYRSNVIDREERGALNVISGSITTEELEEMVAECKTGRTPSEVVQEFLDEKGVTFDS